MTAHVKPSSVFLFISALLSLTIILETINSTAGPLASTHHDPRLLLLSSTIHDDDILAAAANERTIVVRYDAKTTTLDALLDSARSALGGRKAASIAIAAHDYGVAKFYLTGEHTISLGSSLLSDEQRDFWWELGTLVAPGGRIDLLACDLAATREGRELVNVLAGHSGVTVAASTNPTGQPASGGDWLLEIANVDVADIYFSSGRLALFTGLLANETVKLLASDGAAEDGFGWFVAIDGDRIVVGAPGAAPTGAAYVFRRTATNTWVEVDKLIASDGAMVDEFGYCVAIDGDHIVIGAPGVSFDTGAVYVFRETSPDDWTEVTKLYFSDGSSGDLFGWSVAISGDRIAAGAPGYDMASGVVAVFRETSPDTWEETAMLRSSDIEVFDFWGWSVDIDGSTIVFGAPGYGAACVFHETTLDTWEEVDILFPSDSPGGDGFGVSVAIDGDRIVVGAEAGENNGEDTGAAYIFRDIGGTWSEVAKLTASDGEDLDSFGCSVVIEGDRIVIGAPGDDSGTGSAYVFRESGLDNWSEVEKLTVSDGETIDYFGYSVAISGSHIVCGADGDSVNGILSGSASVFRGPIVTVNEAAGGNTDHDGETNLFFGDDSITITATPSAGWEFTGWSGDAVGDDNPLTITGITTDLNITPVFISHCGALRVTLLGASDGGWKVEGQDDWRPSGNIAHDVVPGYRTVLFKPVSGYLAPAPQTVLIREGILSDITATYVDLNAVTGSVLVDSPDRPAPVGAAWRPVPGGSAPADDGGWFPFGETVTGLPEGNLTIEFRPVCGWITPVSMSVTVKAGALVKISANYPRPFIAASADYDGDGSTDAAVYDSDARKWSAVSLLEVSPAGTGTPILETKFGAKNAIPAPGDYDGDGVTDLAYWNPGNGKWRVRKQFTLKSFGAKGDIPVPGDYLGRGYTQPALFRPAEGTWFIQDGEKIVTLEFGNEYDIPVPADYDGDGVIDLGIYDVCTGRWRVAVHNDKTGKWRVKASLGNKHFGQPGDIPVPADYDGDGRADIAVYNTETHVWSLNTAMEGVFRFGEEGDIPVPADWDGDGKADIAVYRSRTGAWEGINGLFKIHHGKKTQPLISSAN
jgi:hypothetical protein